MAADAGSHRHRRRGARGVRLRCTRWTRPRRHYPGCPTKIFTGLDCPFCGSLRATHDLLHGDVVGALSLNAVTVLVILPLTAVAYVLWTYRRWRARTSR